MFEQDRIDVNYENVQISEGKIDHLENEIY